MWQLKIRNWQLEFFFGQDLEWIAELLKKIPTVQKR